MPIPILGIIAAAAQIIPGIAKWAGGDQAGEVAQGIADIATESLPGESDPVKAINSIAKNHELVVKFENDYQDFELGIQQQLTARHQADMMSDSWLSKNIRPLCLVFVTLAITVGVFLPVEYVDATKFKALTDMGVWVYGYYFVGRSSEKTGGLGALAGALRGR